MVLEKKMFLLFLIEGIFLKYLKSVLQKHFQMASETKEINQNEK